MRWRAVEREAASVQAAERGEGQGLTALKHERFFFVFVFFLTSS